MLSTPSDIRARFAAPGSYREVPDSIPRVAQIPPFYQVKPPSGIDFYLNQTMTLPAGAGQRVVVDGVPPVRLTSDYRGVVAFVGLFIDAPTALLDITWSLLFNGSPVQGADNLRTYPRAANNLSIDFPYTILIGGNTLVQVAITNHNAQGPWVVGASVGGWSWPLVDEHRVFGGNG